MFITHDFGVVAEIADRVVVLRRGGLVEMGEAAEVLMRPQQAYTRMLIEAVPARDPPPRLPIAESEPIVLRPSISQSPTTRHRCCAAGASVAAASDVNIEIRRGQTLGIVGESGSGKSTVARCIARLIDPSQGSVLISGRDIGQGAIGSAARNAAQGADDFPGPLPLAQPAT